MRRFAAAAVVSVLVLGVTSAAAKRSPVLATVSKGSVVSLTRLDPMSLRPVDGRSLPVGGGAYLVAHSPRGATLAFDIDSGVVLSFVDTATLRPRGSIALGVGWTGAAAWPSPTRMVAVLGGEVSTRVVVVNPLTRKTLADRSLRYQILLASDATADGVVFLLSQLSEIAPVRLAVAGTDGVVRSVVLAQITGGTESTADGTGLMRTAQPGLALDPTRTKAAVVGADGLVAEVDLRTLSVTYHPRALRAPARAAKGLQGWQRRALWLDSGVLAVTGMDFGAAVKDGVEEVTETPAGLTCVDTGDWRSRVVDSGASYLGRAGSTVLAYGGATRQGLALSGIGLRGYGADGAARFQLFGNESIGDVQVAGGLAYVTGCGGRCFRIVDASTGALVASLSTPGDTRLVGAGI
jgi:hypothetical protein